MNREAVAKAIWLAWLDWARFDPSLPRALRAPWDELPERAREPAYRMADAVLALLQSERGGAT